MNYTRRASEKGRMRSSKPALKHETMSRLRKPLADEEFRSRMSKQTGDRKRMPEA